MVYYRKYRPQKISELDLPSVREKLTAILSSKELPHAFLFTGSKGLGKTSAARILAKAINCTNKNQESRIKNNGKKIKDKDRDSKLIIHNSDIEPCNKCDACISITNGSNIDVLEIDAASNGGVEEMRVLRERVKFASSTLKYKVYIIDEVHMLSTGAFNALLKTLEEPPSHVVFILATTELWKLPATVVSRTFQVLFEKPTDEQITQSLKRIVKGEDLDVEKGVLEKVAHMSDGAFRDGAKLLEELVLASKGGKITEELFDSVFNIKGIKEEVFALLKSYSERDAKSSLEIINKLYVNGVDFKVVFERLVDHLRGILMMRNGIESDEKDVEGLNIDDIKTLLELANEAYGELKFSIIPQLPLELMSVKFCIIDAKQGQENRGEIESKNLKVEVGSLNLERKDETPTSIPKLQSPDDILKRLIETINKVNKPAAALLRSCKEVIVGDDVLTIVTPFPIHADRLKSEKVLPDLKDAVEDVIGKPIDVSIKTS